jgi:hypothetical protein
MRSTPAGIDGPRTDYSPFLVHLTRNDSDENGDTALKNFNSILRDGAIYAYNAHCLHNKRLNELTKQQRNYFKVCCFTETPLDQIHHLTQEIPGRSHKLEPFGFVFRKEYVLSRGAQPAIYVNSYGGANHHRKAFDKAFDIAKKSGYKGDTWKMLPHVNAFHGGYDFAWEREWRLTGDLDFELDDLVCVILPESGYAPLRYTLAKKGIAAISPGWNYAKVVAELSHQQRRTKRIVEINAKQKRLSK